MATATLASLEAFSSSDLQRPARLFLSFKTEEKPVSRKTNVLGRIAYEIGSVIDEIAAGIVYLFGGSPYFGGPWEPEWKGEEQLTIVVNRTGEVLHVSKFMDHYKLHELDHNLQAEARDSTLESFISKYGVKN